MLLDPENRAFRRDWRRCSRPRPMRVFRIGDRSFPKLRSPCSDLLFRRLTITLAIQHPFSTACGPWIVPNRVRGKVVSSRSRRFHFQALSVEVMVAAPFAGTTAAYFSSANSVPCSSVIGESVIRNPDRSRRPRRRLHQHYGENRYWKHLRSSRSGTWAAHRRCHQAQLLFVTYGDRVLQ
jgi:hypothetical protein